MTTDHFTPKVVRHAAMDYLNQGHYDEFVDVIDSLGRRWNPLKHPRDRLGRFIRTFSTVVFNVPGVRGLGSSITGRVSGIDRDENVLVKVEGVGKNAPEGLKVGDYVKVPQDQVAVQTIKALITGRGAAGKLNQNQRRPVDNAISSLRQLGMDEEADKLQQALDIAMRDFDLKREDKAKVQAEKDKAIDLFREVGDAVLEKRGEGYSAGEDFNETAKNLPKEEVARLNRLSTVAEVTYTARQAIGDKTIAAENDEGPIGAHQSEVRIEAATNELRKDYANDTAVWDFTGREPVQTHMEEPTKAVVRDEAREDRGTKILPELARAGYQRARTGLSRLAGWKQAQQVAPYDRWHVDKEENQVIVGSIVHVDESSSGTAARQKFTGMITSIHTDKDGKKTVKVRQFDPEFALGNKNRQGTALPYKDWRITSDAMSLADDGEQNDMFKQLSLAGEGKASNSLVRSWSDDYIKEMQRRYASGDAKRISPSGGFFDVVPIPERVRKDSNGQHIRVGDHVQDANGAMGVVTYIEPNANTLKVQYPDGQKAARISSATVTRLHGPTSDIYPGESQWGDNNYVPTREEAAELADEIGATSVAEVIRDGGDFQAIQAAMSTDVEFQAALDDVEALFDRRDQALAAGQEPSAEDRAELDKWRTMAAASAEQFREPSEEPPHVPEAPVSEDGEEPQNPANEKEHITEGGVSKREDEDGNIVVDDNAEEPIDPNDTEAIENAVSEAEAEKAPEGEAPPPEGEEAEQPPAQQGVANRVLDDLTRFAGELDYKDGVQRDRVKKRLDAMREAINEQDGQGFVDQLRGLTGVVNENLNRNLRGSKLHTVLNRGGGDGRPLHELMKQRLDRGDDLFGGTPPAPQTERPEGEPDQTPEGVKPDVDDVDNEVSEGVLADDGSVKVMQGDQEVAEGFYVLDQATVTEFDSEPTADDIAQFLEATQESGMDGLSIWYDESDGRYRMARVGIFDNDQDAAEAADAAGTNQFVDIASGQVFNTTLGEPDQPVEAIEDPRSEERAVRTPGAGRASARSTRKQKELLDHVAGGEGADPEISRITEAVKNGEEITGADASRLADHIDGMGADQFEKPSDKGVASQMAHRLARAAGEEGARGYSSQNTALRRTSDVGISLEALSQNDEIATLVQDARTDVKSGDMQAAAGKFRQAADIYDGLSTPTDAPSRRAREHAERLEAMGGVTGPAPERVEEPAPATPGETVPEGNPDATAREALDAAGLTEVEPLTREQFSNPDTPRTREVTPQEYTVLALRGKERLDSFLENATPHALEGNTWDEVKSQGWDSVQEEWGGATFDAHTGQVVTGEDDAYAITFRPPGVDTVSVPIGSSQEDFDAAMETALQRFGGEENSPLWTENAHIGVFRNDDTGNYEIDPVLVMDNLDDVEAIGAYSGSEGGAYNFKDGLGYWPPYVAEGAPGGGGAEEGVPGPRGLEGPGEEGGEAEPGVPAEGEAPAEAGGEGPPEVGDPSVWFVPNGPVSSALGSADSVLESERLAEDDEGRPRGWTDTIDEINNQITDIRQKGESGGYADDPEGLASDLRDLAQELEDNLSDPSDAPDDLRQIADALTNAPGAQEAPAGSPFLQADSDPEELYHAFMTEGFLDDAEATVDKFDLDEQRNHEDLLRKAGTGLANEELSQAMFQHRQLVKAAHDMVSSMRVQTRGANPTLEPAHIENYLNNIGMRFGVTPQQILDTMGGGRAQFDVSTPEEFVQGRMQAKVPEIEAEANEWTGKEHFDLQLIATQLTSNDSAASRTRENNRIANLDQFQAVVAETASAVDTLSRLRDPQTRLSATYQQISAATFYAKRVAQNLALAKQFVESMRGQGIDPAPMEQAIRQQLDRFEMGDLWNPEGELSRESLDRANEATQAYHGAKMRRETGLKEAIPVLEATRDLLKEGASLGDETQLSAVVTRLLQEQLFFNGGRMAPEFRKILSDPVFNRYGAFTGALQRADVEAMLDEGEIDGISEATGGRYNGVEWDPDAQEVSPELVTDDRKTAQSVEADIGFRAELEGVTPNVSAALNAMWGAFGGGIHRVYNDITEASNPEAENWRGIGWDRNAGQDTRAPSDVPGVYSKSDNVAIVADSVIGRGRTSVVHHELGHALDSMLGETMSEGAWFTQLDQEYLSFLTKLRKQAQYGTTPDDSIMYWYFRDSGEGAELHNGINGSFEVFAEGYAAYVWGRGYFAEMEQIGSGPITKDTGFAMIGRALSMNVGQIAEAEGKITREQRRKREVEMGKSIFEFFDNLETNRLPEIMSKPRVMGTRSAMREAVLGDTVGPLFATPQQKVATRAQKDTANTHNSKKHGLIQMEPIERGSPEWDEFERKVKEVSPGAGMPQAGALYVTWNPKFAEQGATVIWKSVNPGQPKHTAEYTDEHKATQLAAKFQREKRVNTALDKAHAKAEAEAMYDETAALVLALIETGMRVGSSEKAGSKDRKTGKTIKTFGGATMQAKHVFFPSDTLMRFKFPGKAGKENVYESRNPVLRAAVQQLIAGKKPSDQVFAGTNSGRTIDYLRQATGIDDIINHDTRTRFATNMARQLVAKWPKSRLPKDEKSFKKAQSEVAKKVGLAINDTWTVARESYISNAVWERFEHSAGLPYSFDDSPPYGLVEGEVVTTLVPGEPGGPTVAPEGTPPAPVAAGVAPVSPAVMSDYYRRKVEAVYANTRLGRQEITRNQYGDFAPDGAPLYTSPREWRKAHGFATAEDAPVEEPVEPQDDGNPEPESWSLPQDPESVEEREQWYGSFRWSEPPIVAGPDPEFVDEDSADEEPEPEPEEA